MQDFGDFARLAHLGGQGCARYAVDVCDVDVFDALAEDLAADEAGCAGEDDLHGLGWSVGGGRVECLSQE